MSDTVVLVTGASGFIASHIVRLLQEEGYKVRATVRNSKDEKKVKHLTGLCPSAKHPLEVVDADLTNPESWIAAVNGCKFVIHVASPLPLTSPQNEDELIKPAVEGTLNVLRACAAAKTVQRVVVTSSSVSVCGEGNNEIPYTEKDWVDEKTPDIPVYSKSKIMAEKAAWKFVEDLPEGEQFELAVVNPTLVLGPVLHGIAGSSMDIIVKLMKREIPMIPAFNFMVCDVRDVALAHVKCMTLPEAVGNRHIISGGSHWLMEMAQLLNKEFRPQGYNIPTTAMPGFLTSFLSLFKSELKMGKKLAGKITKSDNTRMTQVLGIQPIDFDKTLLEMAYSLVELGFVAKTAKYSNPTAASSG